MVFMKLLFFFIFINFCFCAYPQRQQVNFRIKGLSDSTAVVGYYFGNKRYVVDTIAGHNGSFTLLRTNPLTGGLYFLYSKSYYLEFVMDSGAFNLTAEKGKSYENVEVSGSSENDVFKVFRTRLEDLQRQQQDPLAKLKSSVAKDSIEAIETLRSLDHQIRRLRESIRSQYPDSFTAAFISLMSDPDLPSYDSIGNEQKRAAAKYSYYRHHFLDGVDLSDPRLLRTPLLHDKVMKYFEQVIPQHPDTIIQETDRLFAAIGGNQELFRYWLVTLFQTYEQSRIMGMDAVKIHLIEQYYLSGRADWISEEYERKLREEVAFVKPNLIGQRAPILEVVDTLLQPIFMEQIEVPYLVLYFYDPDCGHCKKATKALKSAYNGLQELGAEVLGVCTVTDMNKWKSYIRENDLPWLHAADPDGDSRFRVTYDIRSTPRLYLVGPDRTIIAKHLEVNQLANVIQNLGR